MAKRDRRYRVQKSKRRESVHIACKAFEDTDPDLCEWWVSLPEGQGSEVLRRIIRAHIANPEFEQILALLHNLSRDVKGIDQQLKGAVFAPPESPAADTPRLSEEQAEARLSNILSNDW